MIVLKGGRLIDGLGGKPIDESVVVLDGNKITGIGRVGKAKIPEGAEVIELEGKTVLPGLMNCHTHIFWDAISDLKEQCRDDGPYLQGFKSAYCLRQCLEAGVTTIRDMGTPPGLGLAATKAVDQGIVRGPRIHHCGTPLCITGGHTFWFSEEADGPEGVRKAVREQVKMGATWIKMMASGSRQEGLSAKGTVWTTALPEFSMEELRAAADEIHDAGRKITAHATIPSSTLRIVKAGFDCTEHGEGLDNEVIELMVKQGTWHCPTFNVAYLQVERGHEIGMPQFEIERRRASLEKSTRKAEVTAKAAKAGVRMVMGTDAGSPAVPHNEVAREMELMYKLGACPTPMDTIIAATKNPAEMLGVLSQVGTLEEGKLADILVIEGNPLEDLGNLRNVHLVFLDGELVVKDRRVL